MITAFAGSGEPGYSGDGGFALNAQLNAPGGMTADNAGNVYIADAGNNCIRKVTADGKIYTLAGTGNAGLSQKAGPATASPLNGPKSVALDTSGNLYIADALNYRICKITPSGLISTVAGNDTAGYSGDDGAATRPLNLPTGIATDKPATCM